MDKANKVYFKAMKGNIVVMLDEYAPFDELKNSLGVKAKEARKFFGDVSASVIFRGRNLDTREEAALVRTIEEETNLKVYLMEDETDLPKVSKKAPKANNNELETGNFISLRPISGPVKIGTANKSIRDVFDISSDDGMEATVFHKKSLRSGQSIVTDGSVVVLGDVNPGGEIVAGGSIVILGALKGLAHAGAYGDRDAFVAALCLQPVQLRIANMISTVAEELTKQKIGGAPVPSCAFIEGEQICIAPLV